MGLSNDGAGGKTFVQLVNGKFCVRVSAETQGAVKRELTKGKNAGTLVYELQFSTLSGIIKGIEFKNKEFGDFVEILVEDKDMYILQLPWGGGACNHFVKMLPNIDQSKPVEFHTFQDKEGKTAFLVKQDGAWVKHAFTRDNPNGMPNPTQKKVRGKDTWDWSNVEEFLYKVLQKHSGSQEMSMDEAEAEFTSQDQVPF